MTPAQAGAFRVLLVDREGIGRAAIGERLLRRHLARRGVSPQAVRVVSAGLDATDGTAMHPAALAQVERHGANARGFVARRVSPGILESAHLVIAGNGTVRDDLIRRFPQATRRAFTVSELEHLYGRLDPAPLADHPRLLDRIRVAVPGAFDLPPFEALRAYPDAVGDQIDGATRRIADIWSAAVPAAPAGDRPPGLTFALDVFGVAVEVTCTGPEAESLAQAVAQAWGRCAATEAREPELRIEAAVAADPEALVQARRRGAVAYEDIPAVMHHLSSAITVRAIGERVGRLVMLHAGAVALPDGRVFGFVAPSGTGKTTMARMLGAHYGYVTDETLALDGRSVVPYPKPLSVIPASRSHVKEQWGAHSLDLLTLPERPLELTRLVLLDRRADAPEVPELVPVPHLRGLAELAEQVSYLAKTPGRLHALSDLVESAGGLYRLSYRDAADVVTVLPSLMDGAS